MTAVAEVAHAAHAAGLCVLPPKQDGSKAPDVTSWTEYQRRLSTAVELTRWYSDPRRSGIAEPTALAVAGSGMTSVLARPAGVLLGATPPNRSSAVRSTTVGWKPNR